MKVSELIKRLQQCDPDSKVFYSTYYTNDSGTTWDSGCEVEGVLECEDGNKRKFVELKDY